MAVALTLLAGSIAYNVWAFTKPRSRPANDTPPPLLAVDGALPVAAAAGQNAARDTASPPPAADVQFDRSPVWPRNPFKAMPASTRTVEPPPPVSAPEPEIVLNSILYSDTRKLALVNGRTVRIGDRVGDATVLDIRRNEIVVASARGVRTIPRRRTSGKADAP
jgi:hypothetical protein